MAARQTAARRGVELAIVEIASGGFVLIPAGLVDGDVQVQAA
jgi:hypothetical protein